MKFIVTWLLLVASLATLATCTPRKASAEEPFPRVACYAGNRSTGYPLVTSTGALDMNVITKLARFDVITLDITPWYNGIDNGRVDAIQALRRANPEIKILAYQLLGWWYLGPTVTVSSSDVTWARGVWHKTLLATNGFGTGSEGSWWIRWENPATEAALTAHLVRLAKLRLFDGVFFDYLWAQNEPGVRAMQRMIRAVHEAGGSEFLVYSNSNHDVLDTEGSMKEGFPNNLWTSSEQNVRLWREGRPHKNGDWLQAGTGTKSLDTADSKRWARYTEGVACIYGMLFSFGPDRDLTVTPPYHTWWMPEYDIDLGSALGAPAEQPAGVWWRAFSKGAVLVNMNGAPVTQTVAPGYYRFGEATPATTVTVPARDAVFLVRR